MAYSIAETIAQAEEDIVEIQAFIDNLTSYPTDDPATDGDNFEWSLTVDDAVVELGTASKVDGKWHTHPIISALGLYMTGDDWDEVAVELAYRGINWDDNVVELAPSP